MELMEFRPDGTAAVSPDPKKARLDVIQKGWYVTEVICRAAHESLDKWLDKIDLGITHYSKQSGYRNYLSFSSKLIRDNIDMSVSQN